MGLTVKHFIILTCTILILAAAFFGIFLHKRYTRNSYPASSLKERTLAIIKPDAVEKKYTGPIINLIEKNNFSIIDMKKIVLNKHEAETFYAIHAQRPFFESLISFMTSGPAVVMVLQKENAISEWRKLMGATNPTEAEEGTIRNQFGTDVQRNAVHGSDSYENAQLEILYFFTNNNQ